MSFNKMVFAARVLLGAFYVISGMNWFFGYLPLPNIHTLLDAHLKHEIVMEMIRTGWMFQVARLLEVGVGTALLRQELPLATPFYETCGFAPVLGPDLPA